VASCIDGPLRRESERNGMTIVDVAVTPVPVSLISSTEQKPAAAITQRELPVLGYGEAVQQKVLVMLCGF
jgi:hypothetical protein